jgi:integrase/recombinase XerD
MFIEPCVMGVPGPLSAFAADFADELRSQGYTPRSARFQMQLMAHLSRWLVNEGFGAYRPTGGSTLWV